MTKNNNTLTDCDGNNLKPGDKIEDWTSIYDKYHRAVITEIDHEEETLQAVLLEGNNKGETVTLDDMDKVRKHRNKTWMALLPNRYGVSNDKELAVMNAVEGFDAERHDEPVTLWIAEVDQNNWEISHGGGVRSTFIENEQEIEVEPEALENVKDIRSDNRTVTQAVMRGEGDEVQPYLKRVTL